MAGMKPKIMLICTALGFAGTAFPAYAALSGYWDSSKILHAILGQNEIADALKQQRIEAITATKSGYEVKSQDCTVDVVVERKAVDRPGPTPFIIRVGQSTCR